MASAEEARGNAAYSAGNFTDAVKHYTEAIALSPSNHLLYCDRSAAYASLSDYISAISDAQRAVQLNSSCAAGHWRLGDAYYNLRKFSTAISIYENGLRLAPGNEALIHGLSNATAAAIWFPGPQQNQHWVLENTQQQQQQCQYQHQHQVLPTKSLFEKELNVQQQQQLTNQLLMQQQMWKNQLLGSSPTTNPQMFGSGSSTSTFLSTDLAADASTSTGARSTRQHQNLVAGAFDLPGDLEKLTEQPLNISANDVHALWTPQAKACHTSMASLDIASEAIAMQGQGLQASSLGANEAFRQIEEGLEKVEAQHKKQKEANDTLKRKNVELKESLNAQQTRVKELENDMSKMLEDHAQLNVELKARIEKLEEFVAGKHVAWNPSKERALFLEAHPPIQTKEKDALVREVDQPAQDVDKETVEFEGEETFLLV